MPEPAETAVPWAEHSFGQWILAREKPQLAELVRRFHGDTLVWSGGTPAAAEGVKRCMVRSSFYLAAPDSSSHPELSSLKSSLSALPLPNGSAHGFVLHHSLELEKDPREALREVSRVIAPGGRLLICAFNALSLWGLRSLYSHLHRDLFSGMRFVNPLRLFDWLALLGFQTEGRAAYLGFGLPLNLGRNSGRLAPEESSALVRQGRAWLEQVQPPTGGILIVSALKQVRSARWVGRRGIRERSALAPVAYPKPTAWKPLERGR